MCSGGATTTVYPSTDQADVAFIVADSGSRFVFAEDADQLAKLVAARDQLPDVDKVILVDGEGDGDWVISWRDLARIGADHLRAHPSEVDTVIATIEPDHLATLIYTSGTTGRPKGVELPQSCWTYEGACIDAVEILTIDDVQFLWLPLSHSFGKVLLAAHAADRVRHRRRRTGRQDRRLARRGEAHLHGRCAPHLREDPRPGDPDRAR